MNNEHTDSLIANSAPLAPINANSALPHPLAPINAPSALPHPQAPTAQQFNRNDR